jgi:RNA polymerase sigma factor (sigma-70 family)
MSAVPEPEDAELVLRSRAGDREAFERIVARYQALICSLAYSATGNLGRSEELAQETFLAAWRQLGTLREPQRLRSWLCGIARNLTRNAFRSQAREPVQEPLETVCEAPSPERPPSEQAMSREEEAIVWRALEKVPDLYREPLVLFYREGCSVAVVARQLDLSEDAVKQRLARGREMLRAETEAVVEGALRRSRPGRAFTLAVMAALPAVVGGSATAAVLGAVGKAGAPTAKALFSAATMGAWLGMLGGLLGGAAGGWASWKTARYEGERQLLRRHFIFFGVALCVFMVPIVVVWMVGWRRVAGHPLAYGIGWAAWIVAFVLLDLVWSFRLARQLRRLRAKELAAGTAPLPQPPIVRRVSDWTSKWEGRQWRSRWSLLGLPLIDISFSSPDLGSLVAKATAPPPGKPRVARGWIALGDRAHGLLFACGGTAIGGIAIGGVSAGLLAIGGAAAGLVSIGGGAVGGLALGGGAIGALACGGGTLGWWALGGLAFGWMAWGGGAFAWRAAAGGLAYAHDMAVGGKAIAAHANDAVARGFVSHDWFFRAAEWQRIHVIPWMHGPWFVLAVLAFSFLLSAALFAIGHRRRKAVTLGLLLAALLLPLEGAQAQKPTTEADYTAKNLFTHKFAFAAWAQGFRHGRRHAAVQGDIDRASLSEVQACHWRRCSPNCKPTL